MFSLSRSLFSRRQCTYQTVSRLLFSSKPALTARSNPSADSLYRRISPLGDPRVSIVPVLDQWVREGKPVEEGVLRRIIGEMRTYKRFKHALEISEWMSDKRYIPLSTADLGTRLTLITRVHGLEQAEKYLCNIPEKLRGFNVYTSLMNCYALEKSVEKAESVMQKLKDKGLARTPLCYNILMSLYYQIGNYEKLDVLMLEMEEKSVWPDKFTLTIRLSAYADASDSEGVNQIFTRMQSDPRIIMDCTTYSIVAEKFLKVGLRDSAIEALKTMEGLVKTIPNKSLAFVCLLKLYAEAGKKDELFRIWKMYKGFGKIYNKGYITMLGSVLKFDDVEGAEKIFEEWESRGLSYDFRMPDLLIEVYCRDRHLEKAEALLDKGVAKGGEPSVSTWCYLADGYLGGGNVQKAVEALKKAILVSGPSSNPSKDTIVACLQYLEGEGDMEHTKEFTKSSKIDSVFRKKVLSYISSMK